MKTMIVTTDYSPNADNALEFAAAFAASVNTRIILFNAFQLPLHASNSLISASGIDELQRANHTRLQQMAEDLQRRFNIKAEAITRNDYLTDGLDALVAETGAGLVVLGMHENDWGDHLFGNTTTGVIRQAAYPLLIVPEKASYSGVQKIVYAYDSKHLDSQNKLSILKHLASSFRAQVQVLHVETAIAKADRLEGVANVDEKVELALADVAYGYKDVAAKDVVSGIQKGIQEFGADLLAVVPHRLNLWERWLNQSTTRKLALEMPIPLLVLPNPAASIAL